MRYELLSYDELPGQVDYVPNVKAKANAIRNHGRHAPAPDRMFGDTAIFKTNFRGNQGLFDPVRREFLHRHLTKNGTTIWHCPNRKSKSKIICSASAKTRTIDGAQKVDWSVYVHNDHS